MSSGLIEFCTGFHIKNLTRGDKDQSSFLVVVGVFGDDTVVLWNRITLVAHVRVDDVSNEFTVTEFYKKDGADWKLLDLTFSKVKDTHEIEH